MHIIEAFEAAQKNRDKVNKEITNMMMTAIENSDIKLAKSLEDLINSVSDILKPFTE